jgi:hypothetical protein
MQIKTSYFEATPSTYYNTLTATGTTAVIRATGELTLSISGDATAATVVVERSSRDPAGSEDARWITIETFNVNPSLGTTVPSLYEEPGVGWWRARLTSLTGTNVQLDFSYTDTSGGGR